MGASLGEVCRVTRRLCKKIKKKIKKKCLVSLLGRKLFRPPSYITFTLVTDCPALMYLNASKTRHPQIARWAVQLSEFDAEIRYRSRVEMAHIDSLSRAPANQLETHPNTNEHRGEASAEVTTQSTAEFNKTSPKQVYSVIRTEDQIALCQSSDDLLKLKCEILRHKASTRTPQEVSEVRDFELISGLLYKIDGDKRLYVIATAL